jgi:tetratricopeptide (TPR) repeat protein
VLYHRGKYVEAQAELEDSLRESIARGDNAAIARNKRRLGSVALKLASNSLPSETQLYVEKARSLFKSGFEIERNRRSIARITRQIGLLELFLGNYTKAKEHFIESLDIFKSLGNRKGIAATLYNMGIVLETEGKLDEAEKYYNESLEIGKEMNMRSGTAQNILQLASIEYKREKFDNALILANQAVDILVSIESFQVERARKLLDTIRSHRPKR